VTTLDPADLVTIAGRALGISTDDALARMDISAAQDALAEARPPGHEQGTDFRDPAATAAAAVALIRALLRRRPFPGHGQQVAVAAGLQFLSLNGWRADLSPAATTVVVVEALASGRLAPADAAAWLSPRLSPAHRTAKGPVAVPRARPRPRAPLPAARPPAGRTLAGALLAAAVTSAALLAAACSRAPYLPAAPSGVTSVAPQSTAPQPARPAGLAYAACLRSNGFASFPDPSASGVAVITAAAGIDLDSAQFRTAERACQSAEPAAAVRIVEDGAVTGR
jgi:prophage maintenance system killer protein